jgi:hypothetical protein
MAGETGFPHNILVAPQDSHFDYKKGMNGPGKRAHAAIAIPFSLTKQGEPSQQHHRIAFHAANLVTQGQCRAAIWTGGFRAFPQGETEGAASRAIFAQFDVPAEYQDGEEISRHLRENALRVQTILVRHNCQTAILVCQELQSARVLRVYERHAAESGSGIRYQVQPVDCGIWSDNAQRTLRNRNLFIARELCAHLWYRLRGWM